MPRLAAAYPHGRTRGARCFLSNPTLERSSYVGKGRSLAPTNRGAVPYTNVVEVIARSAYVCAGGALYG